MEYDACDIIICEGPDAERASHEMLDVNPCKIPLAMTGSVSETYDIGALRAHCVVSVHLAYAAASPISREMKMTELTGEALFICNKLTRVEQSIHSVFNASVQIRADYSVDIAVAARRAHVPSRDECRAIMDRCAGMLRLKRIWLSIQVRETGAVHTTPIAPDVQREIRAHYFEAYGRFADPAYVPNVRNRTFIAF